ncbi:MAG: hypothetical protein AUJ48_02475 [Deltaproteobacteria bacterium CG1_02_45_11]|nr:MAG: hypothetical protein AUJ48_02475 [Deltaproteobacteria bacterium CG1_02_45_11]
MPKTRKPRRQKPKRQKTRKRPNAFTVKANGMANVLISEVQVAPAFDPAKVKEVPQHHLYKAIWDTGATSSVITQTVVQECGLLPTGMTNVNTASGMTTSLVYLVNFILRNNVGVIGVRVTEGRLSGDINVLIGMDMINFGDFAVTNHNRNTTFTFRIPSLQTIDFVKYKYTPKTLK